ncbi:MAG: hypothetical protein QM781_18000 [Chitinophagaceae bacterium]
MKCKMLAVAILFSLVGFAQNPKLTWGDEFKLKKGSTDLEVIYADKSGVYLQEGHLAVKSYFVIGGSVRSSATLVKLDKNLMELYRNDFNKELKGKEFEQFFVVQDRLYVFATDYEKKEGRMDLYAAELDKNSGEMAGSWKLLSSFNKDGKKDEIDFKIDLSADSTNVILISSVRGREKNEYTVSEFDKTLKPIGKSVKISNEFDPKTFQLQDVLFTNNRKIILVGRVYEYQEGKKKKEKFLEFTNYNIRLYDEQGKQQKEINTNINGRWLNSTRLVQEKNNDLVLAAFYSNTKKGRTTDGMLVQRINPVSGEVISTSEKKIDYSLLGSEGDAADDESDENETKAERKERENLEKMKNEGEAFSRYMRFQRIFYTPDNSLVMVAEKVHTYSYIRQTTRGGTGTSPMQTTMTYYTVYEYGDLLLFKIDAGGNIGWMRVLPKAQREMIQGQTGSGFSFWGYFDAVNRPFYSGFGAMQTETSIQLLFNDNPKNATVTQPGSKVKTAANFGKSHCFIADFSLADGKMERRMFFSNSDTPTSMPRMASVMGRDMYIVGRDDRVFGKTKIAVAKISWTRK